jgi:hypothetical protein
MADKPRVDGQQRFVLGALERDGALWRFTVSDTHCDISLKYGTEENARRARLLIFEALRDALQPGAGAAAPPPYLRRMQALMEAATRRFRRPRR